MRISTARTLLLIAIAAYVGAFQWVYVTWLSPTFDYWGFTYEAPPTSHLVLATVFSVLPGLWLPLNLTRPSQLIIWVLFIAVLVPSMFVPLYVAMRSYDSLLALISTVFAGFTIVSLSDRLPLWQGRQQAPTRVLYWSLFWITFTSLVGWVIAVYFGRFRLVTFGEVYEQLRFSGQEIAVGTGVNYAVMWLSGALVPFLMAWSLVHRRHLWFLVGAAIQILLYSTAGLKSILLSIIVIPLIYAATRSRRIPFGLAITAATAIGFLALNASNLLAGDLRQAHLMLSALVFMRTFGISGLSTAQYHDFFSDHPQTLYSHVSGINLLVDYPYERALGREVGYFYTGNLELNSNAHLWCMDGLAGWGLPGILLVSIACVVVFWLLDNSARGHEITFSATAVSFAALNLSNASLFTSLVSGGLLFTMALFFFMPKRREPESMTEPADDTVAQLDEFLPAPAPAPYPQPT